MKNKVAVVIACLLLTGLVFSAIPASGRGGSTNDKIKKLSREVDDLADEVDKQGRKLNKLTSCFETRVFSRGEYGELEFNSHGSPKAYALKNNSCG